MVVKLLDSTNRTLIYKFHNHINFHKFISHFKLPFITRKYIATALHEITAEIFKSLSKF